MVKCAPLFLGESTLLAAESIVLTSGPAIELQPFASMRTALIAPAERLRGGAFERAHEALAAAVEWYGLLDRESAGLCCPRPGVV